MTIVNNLIKFIDEKQGQDIQLLDMREITPYMDYMIVTHVSNPRLLSALAQYVMDYLDEQQISYRPVDKTEESGWILIDANDIIVHIFLEPVRHMFQLEKLWKEALVHDEPVA